MSYLFPNYTRDSIDLVDGDGCYVYDQDQRRYLDFTSGIGVTNLGHKHPKVLQALTDQTTKIWHSSNLYTNHLQEQVAQKLTMGKDYLTFFCNSGTEANEAAIKLARKATGRTKILSFTQSFHGRTYGALSATGQPALQTGFYPIVAGFDYLPYNQLKPLKEKLTDDVAAVILEVIQGEGGIIPAEKQWLQTVARLCHENNSLLIVDEIQSGMGRTGNFFAFEAYEIKPDIITLAKALANGIPAGAMLGKVELAEAFGPGTHGTTFGGNNLAMQVAKTVVTEINQPAFLSAVAAKGNDLKEGLTQLIDQTAKVTAVRGSGLMIGVELDSPETLQKVLVELKQQQLLALKAGQTVLRLLPPLTISQAELMQGLKIIQQVLLN
ncbi:acetylornithine transaminase [Enterococcus dongliensis]|uniref:Acetylornithine aminotransferase n=1 Tax=Enterococcus dongliensis TaxID=2559925 RepID=A0AAW8TKW7_9ENTE|nr:acetylornithine transaminase [Enterococcus dongliensis]MDT2602724.1 acetylornithine transaminase [Enterococcus dongliensis]MDT2612185.1 acetylornithine transaminase [Enterococcus dongliensis]MDT2633788.1 acetylornithine transaminase [Enterococcus dongliensis]MDT2636376.1 acetylornithine transaminase [Enterococcus dongliensis]MDT2639880.1 acetylornithine transaminase [Enterococcus dongliensis]